MWRVSGRGLVSRSTPRNNITCERTLDVTQQNVATRAIESPNMFAACSFTPSACVRLDLSILDFDNGRRSPSSTSARAGIPLYILSQWLLSAVDLGVLDGTLRSTCCNSPAFTGDVHTSSTMHRVYDITM